LKIREAKASFGQHTSKRGLAHFQRITPQVLAVQLDEVESAQEHVPVMLAVADTLKRCEPVSVARDPRLLKSRRQARHSCQVAIWPVCSVCQCRKSSLAVNWQRSVAALLR
jgi:hypothetical protein